jgi:hypothetical protein
MGRAAAAEAIGDEATWYPAMRVQQLAKEPHSGVAVSAELEQDVNDVLIDSSPQMLSPAVNGQEQFVQVPRAADGPGPTPEPPRVGETECLAPVQLLSSWSPQLTMPHEDRAVLF